jgi:hypothetical protein
MRTMASYSELSPCGWNLPITSPTTAADFLCFASLRRRSSLCMV